MNFKYQIKRKIRAKYSGMEKITLLQYIEIFLHKGKNRTRLEIMKSLITTPKNANQITSELKKKQRSLVYNTVRFHLKKLKEVNFINQKSELWGCKYYITKNFNMEVFNIIVSLIQ